MDRSGPGGPPSLKRDPRTRRYYGYYNEGKRGGIGNGGNYRLGDLEKRSDEDKEMDRRRLLNRLAVKVRIEEATLRGDARETLEDLKLDRKVYSDGVYVRLRTTRKIRLNEPWIWSAYWDRYEYSLDGVIVATIVKVSDNSYLWGYRSFLRLAAAKAIIEAAVENSGVGVKGN